MPEKKKILLIDDEKDFCFFVKRNLEATGEFEVITANRGEEGIKLAERKSPDLIFLDIRMPRKDGFEVLAAIKKNEKTLSIPVVMLTAVESDDAKIKSSGLYSEDYIVKPVSCEKLRWKIDAVLARLSRWRR